MAARRLTSSSLDWAEFGRKISVGQKSSFNTLKSKHDGYIRQIGLLPENLPKIDFQTYKSKISNKALVDDFQKKYEGLKIDYPTDSESLIQRFDSELASEKSKYEKLVSESNSRIDTVKQEKSKWEAMMPVEEMNLEELLENVPELSIDVKNPTPWPHEEKTIEYMMAKKRGTTE